MDYGKYFVEDEFKCPCCDKVDMDQDFLNMLNSAREAADVPFAINSAFRCEKQNGKVGGLPNSAHKHGYAVDISCKDSSTRFKIIKALISVGFERIGVSSDFIHCDNSPSLPSQVIWVY